MSTAGRGSLPLSAEKREWRSTVGDYIIVRCIRANMNGGLALLLVLLGIPGAAFPYRVARFEERMDSIGSKRAWSEVEPAEWKVLLTRVVGAGMLFVGVIILLGG